MPPPLAHSAKPKRGIPEQAYADHVGNVVAAAVANANQAAEHSPRYGALLTAAVRHAAEFHDLGKLDDSNQRVLRTNQGKMFNHVDAGVAHLLDGPPSSARLAAPLAAYAHHIGLPAVADENEKGKGNCFRDGDPGPDGRPLRELTNERLDEYRRRHRACVSTPAVGQVSNLPAVSSTSSAGWETCPTCPTTGSLAALAPQLESKLLATPLVLRLAGLAWLQKKNAESSQRNAEKAGRFMVPLRSLRAAASSPLKCSGLSALRPGRTRF